MKLSILPSSHQLYTEDNKGQISTLQLETAELPIQEALCLLQKKTCISTLDKEIAILT